MYGVYKFTDSTAEKIPGPLNMPVKRKRFILCKNIDFTDIGIDAIADGKINNAMRPAERYCRFGTVAGQRVQAFALAACHYHCENCS